LIAVVVVFGIGFLALFVVVVVVLIIHQLFQYFAFLSFCCISGNVDSLIVRSIDRSFDRFVCLIYVSVGGYY
jgi:hypothetical protein